ncbi:hypothetical protein F4811DRAFT_513817 [Daldinia bambusicola]|nr:hypothetical protein F4811DRAFT_513817 [Daldinia bambusicola]
MIGLYLIRGPLCRPLLARSPQQIFLKRHKFTGRTKPVEKSRTSLPKTPARTRFAPSPTGYVHIGSLRTALYNYLLAKATGGQFLLRVEDTDQTRIVTDAETRLYEDLRWAGLSWDEGPDVGGDYGPYKQSERLKVYDKHAEELLEKGLAYRCFCTPEELDQMRALSIQEGKQPIYNGTCSHISPDEAARRAANGESHCVRFKCGQQPVVSDLVYGTYKKPTVEDDFIIIKTDGYPTYHFANVVDDHLMEITHVIRGAEWLVSTPRHVALYEAFGWEKPLFAHVGLLVNEEKQKLSKRHGDVDVASWRDRGILPSTLLNYVMLLGWSMGRGVKGQQEVMDLDEMVKKFHLGFTKGDITVNNKYEYLQKAHVKRLAQKKGPSHVSEILLPVLVSRVQEYEDARVAELEELEDPEDLEELEGEASEILAEEGSEELQGEETEELQGEESGELQAEESTDLPSEEPEEPEPTPASVVNAKVVAELGDLVPLADASESEDENITVSEEYLDQVLQLDIQNYKDAESYVTRNRFLIWQVPEDLYRSSLQEEMAGVQQLFSDLVQEDPVEEDMEEFEEDEEEELEEDDGEEIEQGYRNTQTVSELTDTLRELLEGIEDSEWTKAGIEAAILPFLRSVYAVPKPTDSTSRRPEPQLWGYHLLRWIIAGSRPGPALIPSLTVLGREETMRRVDEAYEIAKEEEEDEEVEDTEEAEDAEEAEEEA